MLFESTAGLLRSIVNCLQTADEARWDDTLQLGSQCLYELHQMSRPSIRTAKGDANSKFPTVAPSTDRAIRAIPHVKTMMGAIRTRDQEKAVREGSAAIAAMNGTNFPMPTARTPRAAMPATEQNQRPAVAVKQPVAVRKTAALSKRKPARALTAASK